MPNLAIRSLLALALLLVAAPASGNAANPLESVVTALAQMLKECETSAKEEEVDMVEKKGQCENNIAATTKSISVDTKEVSKQEAAKEKNEADAETLAEEIAKLEASLVKLEKQQAKANSTHTKEMADHMDMIQELDQSIAALKEAMTAVEKGMGKGNETDLLQVLSSKLLSEHDKALVESFVAFGQSQPEAKAYESQSGGVMKLMEKLLGKFQDQKAAAETEFRNTGFAYAKLMQQLKQQASADEGEQKSKEADMASAKEKAAEAKGLLEKSSKSLAAGKDSLGELKLSCKVELEEFKQNQKVRTEEIKAIETAISVLGEVGGVEPDNWSVKKLGTALVQVRRSLAEPHGDLRSRVEEFIQERAVALRSRSLALVATRIAKDPLEPAKRMIKDLIIKMVSDAEVDKEEKAYCEKEMKLNVLARSNSQEAVEDLHAQLEAAQAAVVTLSSQITGKSEEIQGLMESLKEATELRQKTKADNTATIKDAKQSQFAVEKAIKALKSFYAKPEETALVQTDDSDMLSQEMSDQSTGNAPYEGSDGGSKIISLLETILGDFSKLEAETDLDEEQAQSDYEKFKVKTEKTIAVSEEENDFQVQKKEATIQNIQNLKKELENAQEKLDAGMAYYEKLKPTCVDNADWQARVHACSEEILALQKALHMLNSA
mmetsp:Transcript_87353/g.151232  ORF Transcript_87353/g.151232 Transcript_87353/m.151232 type:complete len:664 (+) Transcript_87353:89-2080(+)